MKIFRNQVNEEKYILVDYFLSSETSLRDAAWSLAIGQSVGNPNVRSIWETDELFENHSCLILGDENELSKVKEGNISIAFPLSNIDLVTDGISQLLCQVMGGQLDIDTIKKCHVNNITFPKSAEKFFKGPKYGITGIREYTKTFDKPLLGGIVKPKIGITPKVLCKMVEEMVEGGVNFIKEDEIMSNPSICPIEKRVPMVMDVLKGSNVIYAVCINSDPMYCLERVKKVYSLGGNSVHINFWSGLGVYKSIRDLDLPMFVHFQKSGDKILTNKNHDYHIKWHVVCNIAGLMGVDFIHAGMWGGYANDNVEDLDHVLSTLRNRNVLPALSCGMNPGIVNAVTDKFGINYMANVGGALHGHPGGTKSGAIAMRQAIDKDFGKEYNQAIKKWGLIK